MPRSDDNEFLGEGNCTLIYVPLIFLEQLYFCLSLSNIPFLIIQTCSKIIPYSLHIVNPATSMEDITPFYLKYKYITNIHLIENLLNSSLLTKVQIMRYTM